MSENKNIEIKTFGLGPAEAKSARNQFTQEALSGIRKEELSKLQPAFLKPEELAQIRQVEQAVKEQLFAKMRRYGIPAEKLPQLPEIEYVQQIDGESDPHGRSTSGHHMSLINLSIVLIDRNSEFFDNFGSIAHELSHASVRTELRLYPEKSDSNSYAMASGIQVVGNRKDKLNFVEEGLVQFDKVDFFNNYLKHHFPREYEERRKMLEWWIKRPHMAPSLKNPLFRDLNNPEYALPFYEKTKERGTPNMLIATLGAIIYGKDYLVARKLGGGQDNQGLQEYLFTRKLCEMIGKDMLQDDNVDFDEEKTVQAGRDILDKDRYLRTGNAQRKIVKVLGGKTAKAIFQLEDHPK